MHYLSGNSLKIHPQKIRYLITPAINMEPENTGPLEIRNFSSEPGLIFGGVSFGGWQFGCFQK